MFESGRAYRPGASAELGSEGAPDTFGTTRTEAGVRIVWHYQTSSEQRTLQPGEVVVFPVLWSGLSSAPGCTADRTAPGPGSYVLRGRLDTKASGDAAFSLT